MRKVFDLGDRPRPTRAHRQISTTSPDVNVGARVSGDPVTPSGAAGPPHDGSGASLPAQTPMVRQMANFTSSRALRVAGAKAGISMRMSTDSAGPARPDQ